MAAPLPPIQPASLPLQHPAPCPAVADALSATPMGRGGGPLLPTVCRVSSQPGARLVHTQRVFTEMTRNDKSGKSALLGSQCPCGKWRLIHLVFPRRDGVAFEDPGTSCTRLGAALGRRRGNSARSGSGRRGSDLRPLGCWECTAGAEAGDLSSPRLEAGGPGARRGLPSWWQVAASLRCPHVARSLCVGMALLPLLLRTPPLLDQGTTSVTSFDLTYLPQGPISKCSHVGGSRLSQTSFGGIHSVCSR